MRVGVMGEVMRGGWDVGICGWVGRGSWGGGGAVLGMQGCGAGVMGGCGCMLGYAGRWGGNVRHGRFEPRRLMEVVKSEVEVQGCADEAFSGGNQTSVAWQEVSR